MPIIQMFHLVCLRRSDQRVIAKVEVVAVFDRLARGKVFMDSPSCGTDEKQESQRFILGSVSGSLNRVARICFNDTIAVESGLG
ncbi:MAG: hypothetical protein GY768_16675 [Planctomycetaceae bacterium]|nr:hypothetical protein [Planctomycetaceae bacterium]